VKAAAAAWALLALLGPRAAHAAAHFEYLHVRAHEGSASGGHVAIRIDDAVYDFQHRGGLVVPRREDARRFQHLYRTLEHRPIEASRVAATPESVAALRDGLERRLLAQSAQIELAAALDADAAFLASLRAARPELPVRGAGFFEPAGEAGAPSLAALRERIEARHGAGHLAARDRDAEGALRSLAIEPVDAGAVALDPLALPVAPDTSARRAGRALAARAAAALLAAPHRLRAGALVDAGVAIEPPARARVAALRAEILDATVALAASRRPDWGEAFLLGAARLAALDASIERGRLLALDALPADALRLPVTARRRKLLPALLAEARGDLGSARDALLAEGGSRELGLAAFEAAASRVAELERAQAGAGFLRVAPGLLLAEGVAPWPVEPRPAQPAAATDAALEGARGQARAYRARLEAAYGYDLVARNCATELLHSVELAFGGDTEAPLGGRIDARANFVPFVSARSVRARWNVVGERHLASSREHAIAAAPSFAAALRERTTLTASHYAPGDGEGFFLFFTDGAWPLRPLLGALNLGAGLLRAGAGVATLPFDRGRGVASGLDGAFWSLPELFFANVRKGTSEYVPPERRPPLD
jgi:hypothetical protein